MCLPFRRTYADRIHKSIVLDVDIYVYARIWLLCRNIHTAETPVSSVYVPITASAAL